MVLMKQEGRTRIIKLKSQISILNLQGCKLDVACGSEAVRGCGGKEPASDRVPDRVDLNPSFCR